MAGQVMNLTVRGDVQDGGGYQIVETVTRLGVPTRRRVRLCDGVSGRVVREAWSDATTGQVIFSMIRLGPWQLCALDHTDEFQSVMIAQRMATPDGSRPI